MSADVQSKQDIPRSFAVRIVMRTHDFDFQTHDECAILPLTFRGTP